jgi:endonuclease YncB( thermonuclease family)
MLMLLLLGAQQLEQRWNAPDQVAGFGEAIDGDSLRVAGREIRLKGVDAPEIDQYCADRTGRNYACGVVARSWLHARLQRGAVICRIEGRDRYGRLLGACTRGEELLNAAIVREGRAVDYGDYPREEQEARAAQRGLWSGRFTLPSEHRAMKSQG